ncbi:unnamed protein product [Blepharisma stoltei]|uniref:Inosine/uridine-preferring nucleoside hydrolase domain-containing protein n=1 Tax=Blepharisma stoltei TaxID=1481888 RepID=A0AAU9K572_9CILI|nr:unnamed protein product [Blepharisma stoltei]
MSAIWLDCDPGHDDAMAIILAAYSANLLGISTSAGNQTIHKTTRNAIRVLSAIGKSYIPVVKGQAAPLIRPSMVCAEIHGESGLDGLNDKPLFDEVDISHIQGPAPPVMYEQIRRYFYLTGQKVRLVGTGCLTNIALLLVLYPDVKSMIDISIMGGAIGIGNISPSAEFNILLDPEAAKIVFESGVDLVMIPLEVTHTALVTNEVLQKIGNSTPFTAKICELLNYFRKNYKEVFDFADPPLHDPLAIAYVLRPDLFTGRSMRVDIETQSDYSYGRTICDVWNKSTMKKNCWVATKVELDGFWDLMIQAVELADSRSSLN